MRGMEPNYQRALGELVEEIDRQLQGNSVPAMRLEMGPEMVSAIQEARMTLRKRERNGE